MIKIPTILELFKAGVHFGHRISRRHPKMEPFIFTQKNGVHIIDLEQTQEKLKEALDFIKKIVSNGGIILFLGTKNQAQPIVKKYAESCQMPYVANRWLGGTFTNFSEILKVIKKYKELKRRRKAGDLDKYTKKEQLKFSREIENLDNMVGGIENLDKLPAALYVIDVKNEKTAINEAYRKEIPIVAMCDTNINPSKINYVIPANDDAIKSIEMITGFIAQAVNEGSKEKEIKINEQKQKDSQANKKNTKK